MLPVHRQPRRFWGAEFVERDVIAYAGILNAALFLVGVIAIGLSTHHLLACYFALGAIGLTYVGYFLRYEDAPMVWQWATTGLSIWIGAFSALLLLFPLHAF